MTRKPALLSGKDFINMGIIKINTDNVYSPQQQQQDNQIAMDTSIKAPMPKDTEKKPITLTKPLTKEMLVEHYRYIFTGVGCLQPLVSFKVKDDVVPVQMPIHCVTLSKIEKEKTAINHCVKEETLEKVNDLSIRCQHSMNTYTNFRMPSASL